MGLWILRMCLFFFVSDAALESTLHVILGLVQHPNKVVPGLGTRA